MKKGNMILWVGMMCGLALQAQGANMLGKNELISAFKQYNEAALAKTETEPVYRDIFTKLMAAYSVPNTEANQIELIALAKNFDNSLWLQAIREEYTKQRTVQQMTGTELSSLDKHTMEQLLPVVKNIFQNTLEVKDIQIRNYKEQIKSVKKAALPAEQTQTQVAGLNQKIAQVKKEKSLLKKNSKAKIKSAAEVYFEEIRTDFANRQK